MCTFVCMFVCSLCVCVCESKGKIGCFLWCESKGKIGGFLWCESTGKIGCFAAIERRRRELSSEASCGAAPVKVFSYPRRGGPE